MKITVLKYLTYLCTMLTAGIVIPAAEPVTIIRIINHTGGEINIELGQSKARIMDNGYYDVNIRSSEIPLLKVESTKRSFGYWWQPIQVNITEQFNKKTGRRGPIIGENIIIEVTSSRVHGYLADIRLSDQPIQKEEISYKNIDSPWEAFPAVKKEYLTPGLLMGATYKNYDEVHNLLYSTDEQQKPARIRLARIMLGLPQSYTKNDVKRHFREISFKYHPDKIPPAESNDRTKALSTIIIHLLGRAQEILLEP